MSDTHALPPPASAPPAITLWPVEHLRARLIAADAVIRLQALAMSVQPGAPVDGCIDEIIQCATLANGDPAMLQFVAVALGGASPSRVNASALELLSALLDQKCADPVRIFAAHALFRLKVVPESAFVRLSALLVHAEPSARQIALAVLTLVIKPAASAITQMVAALPPDRWTTEALSALARSAGDSAQNRGVVEQYVMRSLPSAAIVPTGIAGYAALAHLSPNGKATAALVRIVSAGTEPEHWRAALKALSTLGESAQSAAAELGAALIAIDDPDKEEALCRVLVGIGAKVQDLPVARVIQRIESGPERSAAAHCMLLALHAKHFAATSKTIRMRYATASGALKPTLAQTHLALAGTDLGGMAAQRS